MNSKNSTKNIILTVTIMSAALIAIWFVFYFGIRSIIRAYTVDASEKVAETTLENINKNILELEKISLKIEANEYVKKSLSSTNSQDFFTNGATAAEELSGTIKEHFYSDSVIVFDKNDRFFRLTGEAGNASISWILTRFRRDDLRDVFEASLYNNRYMGFITRLVTDEGCGVIFLIREKDIDRLFLDRSEKWLELSIVKDGNVLFSKSKEFSGEKIEALNEHFDNVIKTPVGISGLSVCASFSNDDYEVNLLFYMAMILMALVLALILVLFIRVKEKEKELYLNSLAISEAKRFRQQTLLDALKKQIDAHFTVNVISSIKALAEKGDSDRAAILCDGLAYLLRYANAGDSQINAMDEFFVLQKYVDIMKVRYPGKFEVELGYEDYLEDIMMPRMLLQPILENAIIHGANECNRKVEIRLSSKISEDMVEFIVTDNGAGIDEDIQAELKRELDRITDNNSLPEETNLNHIALINIKSRLVSFYGEKGDVSIDSKKDEYTIVSIRIPLK